MIESATAFAASSGRISDGRVDKEHKVGQDQVRHVFANELEPQPESTLADAAETSPYLRHVVSRGAGDEDGDAEEAQPQAADP